MRKFLSARMKNSLLLISIALLVYATAETEKLQSASQGLTLEEIDEKLQTCDIVQTLNKEKLQHLAPAASWTKRLFAFLFPGSPAVNSLLATAYISGPPSLFSINTSSDAGTRWLTNASLDFILALVPANIDPSSLTVMVAFAVGGILGDVFFHLLPQTFMGEAHDSRVHFVLLEEKRNTLLGLAILVGFVAFVILDKGLRIAAGGGDGHGHDHSHGKKVDEDIAISTGVEQDAGILRHRKGEKDETAVVQEVKRVKEASSSIKVSSYLNMAADFFHNSTDGLAIASSFYAGPTIGATTTVAVFFHEIPHEVGDFALLIQAGFTKYQAIGAQFFAAIGAFLGTFVGIYIQEYSLGDGTPVTTSQGLLGTSATIGDLVLPFTAGGFLYIATVGVIPELLETGPNKMFELRQAITQLIAMSLGAGIMLVISFAE